MNCLDFFKAVQDKGSTDLKQLATLLPEVDVEDLNDDPCAYAGDYEPDFSMRLSS
jgi:hypothetical protein